MDNFPLNILDIVVVVVVLGSAILAFMRGFVHEVLAVAAWVGAIFATLYGLPLLRPWAREQIVSPLLADIVAGGAIFLVSLLVLAVLTKAVAQRVRQSALNSLDSSLGFVFGLARGALVVSLAYMLGLWLIGSDEDLPAWLSGAKTRPYMERGAEMIKSFIPNEISGAEAQAEAVKDGAKQMIDMENTYRTLVAPTPQRQDDKTAGQEGYEPIQRRDMDRLFEYNSPK